MNGYLIPANANRGKLIFSFFRKIDLIIFGCGAGTTLILLLVFQNLLSQTAVAIGVLLPVVLTGLLVIPIPNQHNVLVVLINIYKFFFVERRKYLWKGWCSNNVEEDRQ